MHELANGYLEQVTRIVAEMAEVFDALDEDAGEYTDGLITALPAWLLPDRPGAIENTVAEA